MDVRRAHHIGPFFGFVRDQLAERRGAHRHGVAAEFLHAPDQLFQVGKVTRAPIPRRSDCVEGQESTPGLEWLWRLVGAPGRCQTDAMPPPAVVAVVGPTAAGKSGLSLRLAQSLGGEVVNADSMQLYRGMDIGTAKLPPGQRGGVPHHLLDIWEVTRTASVSEYQDLARRAIEGIHARGRVPILVGGSGLYAMPGLTKAKEYALTGKPLSGREAADVGLINRAVPFDELEATTRQTA